MYSDLDRASNAPRILTFVFAGLFLALPHHSCCNYANDILDSLIVVRFAIFVFMTRMQTTAIRHMIDVSSFLTEMSGLLLDSGFWQ